MGVEVERPGLVVGVRLIKCKPTRSAPPSKPPTRSLGHTTRQIAKHSKTLPSHVATTPLKMHTPVKLPPATSIRPTSTHGQHKKPPASTNLPRITRTAQAPHSTAPVLHPLQNGKSGGRAQGAVKEKKRTQSSLRSINRSTVESVVPRSKNT